MGNGEGEERGASERDCVREGGSGEGRMKESDT
jgi:hypothetical protein